MTISNLAKYDTKVWNVDHGNGKLFARSLIDDEVFLVRFERSMFFIHRKELTEVVK
jgi:hypothetical protein